MAASVRIEDEAFSDERYEDLAQFAGLVDADHARGKMARLWRQCTLENRHILPRATVVRVLGERGVEALIESRLGEVVDDRIRIKGTRGRIEWLKKLRNNGKFGKRGGRPKRNPQGFPEKPTRVSKNGKELTPPAPAPAPIDLEKGSPALALFKDKVDAATGDIGKQRNKIAAKSHPDQQRVIDAFHQAFKAAYSEKPTWGLKEIGQLGTLLKKHPTDVVLARMEFMFAGKAKFPPPPYSLAVFVSNFDRFVDINPAPTTGFRRIQEIE